MSIKTAYVPKNAEGKFPAIAVCGPIGAVAETKDGTWITTQRGMAKEEIADSL